MWKQSKRILIFIVAVIFFVLGLIGLVVPIMPQFVFFAVSIILFSILSPSIQKKVEFYTRKYPKVHKMVVKIDNWIRGVIGEI
ncbi:hypothetical protein H7X87_04075 [Acetobacteraceae bacterium]|nr:hypothetical protein [Candidatus Parcubacteria bacterium]